MKKFFYAGIFFYLFNCSSGFAQNTVSWQKLYDKNWKISEASILRPARPDRQAVIEYSRGNPSLIDLSKMEVEFIRNGTLKGFNADGSVYSGAWKFEGENAIFINGDDKPAQITKLTDQELILQIPQHYTSPITNEEEFLISQYKYIADATALPVVLISFTVSKLDDNSVGLIWKTALEIDSEYFDIQHSIDARSFKSIGKILAKSDKENEQTYKFTHINYDDFHINYYRLKMVDKDGSFTYSKIQSIEGVSKSSLKLSPNPTTDEVFIAAKNLSNIISVKVLDLEGKVVYKSDSVIENKLSLKNYTAGTYVIVIEYRDGQKISGKIVKK